MALRVQSSTAEGKGCCSRILSPGPQAELQILKCTTPNDVLQSEPEQAVSLIGPRHTFSLSPFLRVKTEDDRVRDRGARSYATLTKHRAVGSRPGPPDTTFSIFTERHANWRPSEAEQAEMIQVEKAEVKLQKKWWNELKRRPIPRETQSEALVVGRSSIISSLRPAAQTADFATPVKAEPEQSSCEIGNIEIMETIAVQASAERLNPKILDFEARLDVMGTEQYKAYSSVRESIYRDMKNQQSPIGNHTQQIASFNPHQLEDVLRGHFVSLANAIESRLIRADRALAGSEALIESPGTFQALGDPVMNNDGRLAGLQAHKLTHKIDILMHEKGSQMSQDRTWNRALSFGEVKKSAVEDLKDSLLGQMMVYVLKILQNTPISGKLYFFTQCGPILRVWWVDAEGLGTSTAFDFRKTADFDKIIDLIAFFSGPADQIAERWSVEDEDVLKIKDEEGSIHAYKISDAKWLACTAAVYGSRTVAWSVIAKPLSDSCPRPPKAEMRMIIKSTWLQHSHVKQEVKTLTHLHKPGKGMVGLAVQTPDDGFDIPYPVGTVINIFVNDAQERSWMTTCGGRQNSTMATFCVPAQMVPDDVAAVDRFWLLEGYFRGIRYMTERGVLYRDVNEGNIMQNIADGCRAVIIDFGNARIDGLEDGQEATNPDPAGLDAKIARSVNKIFSSRRIHRLVDLEEKRSKEEKIVQADRRKLRRTTDPRDKHRAKNVLKESKRDLESTTNLIRRVYDDCCHLDDCESGMFWYLYSCATSYMRSPQIKLDSEKGYNTDPGDVLNMARLETKKAVWETEYRKVLRLLDFEIATHFKSLRDEIDAGNKQLQLPRDRTVSKQERRVIQLRRIDNCLQIFTKARLAFDEISHAFQAQMIMGPSDDIDSDDSS